MWGERDVRRTLTSRINENDQTLEVDMMHDIDTADPWYLVHKVLCIVYSYAGQPLNLMVTHDGAGVHTIGPERVEPVSFWNPLTVDRAIKSGLVGAGPEAEAEAEKGEKGEEEEEDDEEEDLTILAVIWGGMLSQHGPVVGEVMSQIQAEGKVVCTNEFFGFDGYPGEHKTCQVFYRVRGDDTAEGVVRCKVAREGGEIVF